MNNALARKTRLARTGCEGLFCASIGANRSSQRGTWPESSESFHLPIDLFLQPGSGFLERWSGRVLLLFFCFDLR